MASLYERNGNFYGQWYDASRRPRQKRHSLKTQSRKTARQLLRDADDAYRLGKWDPWVDPISVLDERPREPATLREAIDDYLEVKRRTLRTPTLATYRSILTRFGEGFGMNAPLARLSVGDVDGFISDEAVAASTQRLRLRVIRAFCRWAVREGVLEESPTRRVIPPPVPPRVPKAATPADVEAVCSAIEADYRERLSTNIPQAKVSEGDLVWIVPLLRFALYTGLRASELARLRWGHVDMERGLIVIERQKNGQAGTIPINTKAASILESVEEREPEDYVFTSPQGAHLRDRSVKSFVNVISRRFTQYRKAAGIERRLTFHSLRHGFATELARCGKSAWVIQAACRHSSVTVSQVYVSLANEHLKAELNDVFA